MKTTFTKILLVLLVVVSFLSGTIKVVGIRIEFMKITHVGFDNWKITLFGAIQLLVALLLGFKKTVKLGAICYSLTYAFATWCYFYYGLQPKIVPVLLTILPMALLFFKKETTNY